MRERKLPEVGDATGVLLQLLVGESLNPGIEVLAFVLSDAAFVLGVEADGWRRRKGKEKEGRR